MKARIAGILWLIVIGAGLWSFIVLATLIVRNDPAATAANILASEQSYRLAFVASLIAGACYMGVTAILYDLLKPVNRTLSLLAAFFGVAGVAAGAAASVVQFIPLVLLGPARYATGFTATELEALAYVALRVQTQGSNIGMVFFGLQCFSAGYLIFRSGFIPRILGVLLALGGLSYITASFATFVAPELAARLAYGAALGLLGEGSFTVWLIVTGANRATRGESAARSAGASMPRTTLA